MDCERDIHFRHPSVQLSLFLCETSLLIFNYTDVKSKGYSNYEKIMLKEKNTLHLDIKQIVQARIS